jgi:hypothetical protein
MNTSARVAEGMRNRTARRAVTSAPIPPAAYLLADHLDAALAAGEDLVGLGFAWRAAVAASAAELAEIRAAERTTVERIRLLEASLLARILRGREHARELARGDARIAGVARLFLAGTTVLLDAVAETGDATVLDFESGDGLLAYLRSRALIAADAASPAAYATIKVDEGFLVAQRLPLGGLLDLAATFLDTLELHYELYAAADAESGHDEDGGAPLRSGGEATFGAALSRLTRSSRAA